MKYKTYTEFLKDQTPEFISEVHETNKTETYKHRVIKSCTLDELKELDNVFINASKASSLPKG
jgi:hypothetical protein